MSSFIKISTTLVLVLFTFGGVNAEGQTSSTNTTTLTRYTPPANIPPVSIAKSGPTSYNNNTTGDAKLDAWAASKNIPLNTVTADGKCGDICKATLMEAMNKDVPSGTKTEGTKTEGNNAAGLDSNNSTDTNNILGIESGKLRKGDVNMQSVVDVILNIIGFLLGIAGTVAIFSLIYHAVKMQLSSGITGDSSGVEAAKKGMIGSVIGFVIAISAWFLVTRIVALLIQVS